MIPRVGTDSPYAASYANPATATPILMLTARDAVEDRIAGLDSGADDYLINRFRFLSCSRGSARCYAGPRKCERPKS